MPSPLTGAIDLLTPIPITTITEEAEYSEIAMATVARAIHGLTAVELPAKKEFVSKFLLDLQPWLPTTSTGRMSKRIIAYMFKTHGAEIAPRLVETIGTYLGQNSPSGPWMFDITNKFNWRQGEFGDNDACFLSSRRYVLDAMMEDGCTAIRFYDQLERPLGMGRAWIAPSEEGPVIFNAYGPDLSLVKGRIAQLLPNESLRLVSLTNQGSSMGQLYINQGIAILAGGQPTVQSVNIDIYTGANRPVPCANCGVRVHHGNLRYVQDDDDQQIRVCGQCFTNEWAQDYFTGTSYRKEKLREVEVVTSGGTINGGWAYEGEVRKVWVFPERAEEHDRCDRCDRCERLCNGYVYISFEKDVHHWCYLCAHEAPLECRHCSFYLPEGETECQCGSKLIRKRDEQWA